MIYTTLVIREGNLLRMVSRLLLNFSEMETRYWITLNKIHQKVSVYHIFIIVYRRFWYQESKNVLVPGEILILFCFIFGVIGEGGLFRCVFSSIF